MGWSGGLDPCHFDQERKVEAMATQSYGMNQLRIAQQEVYWLFNDDRKAAREIVRRLSQVVHPFCYGRFYDTPLFANTVDRMNSALRLSGREKAIELGRLQWQKRQIWSHIAAPASQRTRLFWFVNRSLRHVDGRVLLLNIDIDNHHGATDEQVETARIRIAGFFDADTLYWEASTAGRGLHGYTLLIVPEQENMFGFWGLLEVTLQGLLDDLEVTVELKGKPPRYDEDGLIVHAGSLAKLPRPQSKQEALNFIGATDYRNDFKEVVARCAPLTPTTPSKHPHCTDLIVSASPCPKPQRQPREDILESIRQEHDGFRRRNRFSWYYLRFLVNGDPTPEDCNGWYERLGVNRTPVDSRRLKDFQSCLDYWVTRTARSLFTFDEALGLVEAHLPVQDLSQAIQEAKATYSRFSPFRHNEVAAVLFCLTTSTLKTWSDPRLRFTFGISCALASIKAMVVEGFQTRAIDNKQLKVILRLLEDANLIVCLDRGYVANGGRGVSRKWGLSPSHPLYQQFHDNTIAKEAIHNRAAVCGLVTTGGQPPEGTHE